MPASIKKQLPNRVVAVGACAAAALGASSQAFQFASFSTAPGSLSVSPSVSVTPSPTASSASSCSATSVAAVSLASAALLVGCKASRRNRQSGRVAVQALGSIDQFKVFGPEDDPFEILTSKVLGVGGQGTVYECIRQSDPSKVYAVKTIPIWRLLMDPSSAEKIGKIEKEANVLLHLQGHPNVAECIGCWDAFRPGTSQAQYKMMVMELIPGGELAAFIKEKGRLDEAVAKNVARQTAEGLKFIHDRKVLHRDLKAENILVCGDQLTPETRIKLIDFGVAKEIANTFARSCVGTTEIMAPELVSAKLMLSPKGANQKRHGPYTFKAPQQESPGFGIISQRPDGKGAMVNGVQKGGQAEKFNVGDGWAIAAINGVDITEKPFVKDFNEIGAGTKAGVTAIAEILGGLNADFTLEFVELPKRQFSEAVDLWSFGVVVYTMLAGKTPFKNEEQIVNGEYLTEQISHVSPDALDLIKKLLVLDPEERLKLDKVLSHPWLQA